MLKIAICDDEQYFLSQVQKEIRNCFIKYGCDCQIECFQDPLRLRKEILSGEEYDVLFLDIQMPRLTGLQLAKYLREIKDNSKIIFISNHEQCVFDSFEVSPFGFIRKNTFFDEIDKTVYRLSCALSEHKADNILIGKVNLLSVNPYTLQYVECMDKTLLLVSDQKVKEINFRLKELEEKLIPFGFIRIHKGYLVNYRFIFSIENTEVLLDNGKSLPVSRYRLADVRQEYKQWVVIGCH